MNKVSLVLSTFNRPYLLALSLGSIAVRSEGIPLEIVVVNDGVEDETESWVNRYRDRLDIKYIFSGHRNKDGSIERSPGFANNIGIKESTGDIIVLSCPEIYHINNALRFIVDPLLSNKKLITIPKFMYVDDTDKFTGYMAKGYNDALLPLLSVDRDNTLMPFFLGVWKQELMDIGGYDEDFTGYAGEDNDLMDRLIGNGCRYYKTPAEVVHLYHGPRCDGKEHFDDPKWVHNYNLRKERRGIIIRNVGREWGKNGSD